MLPEIKIENGNVHLLCSGGIYVQEATIIREKLLQYADKGYRSFIIHMDHVEYIDSSGLGVFVAIQKRVVQKNGNVIIKGLNGKVKELFELTRLTNVFQIED